MVRLDPTVSLCRLPNNKTVACDKRLHRLISYLNHTADDVTTNFVGDPLKGVSLVSIVTPASPMTFALANPLVEGYWSW